MAPKEPGTRANTEVAAVLELTPQLWRLNEYVSAEFELQITAGFTFKSAQITHARMRSCAPARMHVAQKKVDVWRSTSNKWERAASKKVLLKKAGMIGPFPFVLFIYITPHLDRPRRRVATNL